MALVIQWNDIGNTTKTKEKISTACSPMGGLKAHTRKKKKKKKKKKKIRLEKEKEKISYIRRTLLTWHLGKLVGVFSKSAAYLNQDSDKDALQK